MIRIVALVGDYPWLATTHGWRLPRYLIVSPLFQGIAQPPND